MCVYVHIYTVCVRVYVHVYIYKHAQTFLCIHMHMCVCVCVCVCVYVCVYQKTDTRPSIRWMFQKMDMIDTAADAGAAGAGEESMHRSLLRGR